MKEELVHTLIYTGILEASPLRIRSLSQGVGLSQGTVHDCIWEQMSVELAHRYVCLGETQRRQVCI